MMLVLWWGNNKSAYCNENSCSDPLPSALFLEPGEGKKSLVSCMCDLVNDNIGLSCCRLKFSHMFYS